MALDNVHFGVGLNEKNRNFACDNPALLYYCRVVCLEAE